MNVVFLSYISHFSSIISLMLICQSLLQFEIQGRNLIICFVH